MFFYGVCFYLLVDNVVCYCLRCCFLIVFVWFAIVVCLLIGLDCYGWFAYVVGLLLFDLGCGSGY